MVGADEHDGELRVQLLDPLDAGEDVGVGLGREDEQQLGVGAGDRGPEALEAAVGGGNRTCRRVFRQALGELLRDRTGAAEHQDLQCALTDHDVLRFAGVRLLCRAARSFGRPVPTHPTTGCCCRTRRW